MDESDGELARRIRSGDEGARAAESDLARRFAHRIRAYGLRHLRNPADADDLVQQVLVVVIESVRTGKLREPDRLASFVLGTCRLTAQSVRGGARRHQRLLDQFGIRDDVVAACEPLDLERLRTCLESLPPRDRAIVVLTFFAERSGDDIGAELGMTPGHVRVSRHRALGRLQQCIEPAGAS